MTARKCIATVVSALALATALTACSSGSTPGSTNGAGGDGGGAASGLIQVDMGAAGCSPASLRVPTGKVDFLLSNRSSSNATHFQLQRDGRTVADVTNVLGGLTRKVSVDLNAGTYVMRCGSNSGQVVAVAP